MRTMIVTTAAAAALVTAVTGYAVEQAASADSLAKPPTFTLVEHAITDTTTDTGAKGDSVGDILTFANPLYDSTNKRVVGSDNGTCIRTVKGKAYECTWTNTFATGGSIVVTGPFYDARDSTLAITGGTGKYVSAHGQMRLHARNAAGSAYDFTFSTTR